MKKSELKNIIKECVREVIFEEGMISGIVSEVVQGLGRQPLTERTSTQPSKTTSQTKEARHLRQSVMKEVGNRSYEDVKKKFSNPALFEGTRPLPAEGKKGSALAGQDPSDPGVDISSLPGFGAWGSIASNIK